MELDSESLTGATRLCEKAGMRIDELNHAYEEELRAGEDLVSRSVPS